MAHGIRNMVQLSFISSPKTHTKDGITMSCIMLDFLHSSSIMTSQQGNTVCVYFINQVARFLSRLLGPFAAVATFFSLPRYEAMTKLLDDRVDTTKDRES